MTNVYLKKASACTELIFCTFYYTNINNKLKNEKKVETNYNAQLVNSPVRIELDGIKFDECWLLE